MSIAAASHSNAAILIRFLAMGTAWGSSFLFVAIAMRGLSPGQVVWTREILGAMVLGVIMIVMRQKLPREPIVWLHFLVIGLANTLVPHLLFSWAQQYIASGLAAIYNSLTPIATALLAVFVFRIERPTRSQGAGIMIGIVGVVVIIAPWSIALGGSMEGQLACLIAAISIGFALAYMRKFVSHRPLGGTTVAFMNVGMAAAVVLVLTPWIALGPIKLDWTIVLALVMLGAVNSGITFVWNIEVLRAWGTAAHSTVTYVIPIVGVLLGVVVLHEKLSWNEPTGAVVVLLGIVLAQGRFLRKAPPLDLPVAPDLGDLALGEADPDVDRPSKHPDDDGRLV